MEIRNIFTFLRVAELNSFTKAALELSYAQSTVTLQIQQLEAELGAPLFDRIGKRIALTQKGEAFFQYANKIVQLTEQAKLLGTPNAEIRGVLRVGSLESLFERVFVKRLMKYHEQFPLIRIETKLASGVELLEKLKRNELDLVFLMDHQSTDQTFVRALVQRENIVFVTRSDEKLASMGTVSLSEIFRYPLMLTEWNSAYRKALEAAAAKAGLKVAPFLEIDSTGIIREMLRSGSCAAFLPEYAVAEDVARGELSIVPVRDCRVQLWVQIFYHKDKWLSPQMQGFINCIRDYYPEKAEEDGVE